MGAVVYLDRPPRSAFLEAWGRARSSWWGCVKFRVPVVASGDRSELPVAAWVPAAALSRPTWSQNANDIPRLHLAEDQRSWAPPTGWPYWYAGVWSNGPIALPAGVALVEGPAWRR